MSYSKNIKLEILKKQVFKNEPIAFLQGLFLSCGSLALSKREFSFVLTCDLEETAELAQQKLISIFGDGDYQIVKIVKSFKNQEKFELSAPSELNKTILTKLGIISNNNLEISDVCDKSYMQNEQKMKAFLVGVFLGSGSISVPQEDKTNKGYHFEIDVGSKNQVDIVAEIFASFDVFPKQIIRKENYILYLKNSETICDLLGIFGASKAVLDVENQRVLKDMNNLTNRQINCISANIDKTVNASIKQVEAIDIIQSTIGLENLPETLSEVALLRLGNPEASLKDLIKLMNKPISKGALAQRFDKLIKLSKELGDDNG